MADYGYRDEGSDLLASCIQSKDQDPKPGSGKRYKLNDGSFEKFNEIIKKGSYTFKS